MTDEEFLDPLGATNLIPGPNLTGMAIHLGFVRAGWPGLIFGGLCIILPSVVMVIELAWACVWYGSTPQVEWLLYGIKSVVIALIVQALWILGRKTAKSTALALVMIAVMFFYFLGVNELLLLAISGLAYIVLTNFDRIRIANTPLIAFPFIAEIQWLIHPALQSATFSLPVLFLTFLKIGSVLYGSGFVLLAFLQADFVDRLGWLTSNS